MHGALRTERRRSRSGAALRDRYRRRLRRATSPCPRARGRCGRKWRNAAEAVTPCGRENVGSARERETSAHETFRNCGLRMGSRGPK
ncbi:unnamed protein product [Parnassius apollo]|uniref:(apollo) hypothetical protein n=1 Tax=Parnassius apollo TaxID=110799 RepID=A0A8S3WZN7_PARAO|nr:unnamed protein product [Parnassius apollo]